jgi:phenylacetyl-CoA:acceptor oxidoreductase subunit 1
MVIDLRKCIGCGTCREVCDRIYENHGGSWRQVIEAMANNPGGILGKERLYLTMSCMHCDNPPCKGVCPTGATYSRPDGIVEIRESLCVGCGACVVACPYRARSLCTEDGIRGNEGPDGDEKDASHTDRIGISTKCNFCSPIVDAGLDQGLQPGIDPEATPLCVRFCISEALNFGDLDDKESTVSRLVKESKTTRLLEEMSTEPKIYYILK